MKNHILAIAAVALVFFGFLIAWGIYRPKPAPPETAAPQVVQKDGSVELERAAGPGIPGNTGQKTADTPTLKAAGIIPNGAKILRNIEVTVDPVSNRRNEVKMQGNTGATATVQDASLSRANGPGASTCAPVTVDLSLIQLKDKTQRVIASSPDGKVVGGLDVPVTETTPFKVQRWTASALAGYDSNTHRNVFGGSASYERGPFAVTGGIIGGTAFIGAGVKF